MPGRPSATIRAMDVARKRATSPAPATRGDVKAPSPPAPKPEPRPVAPRDKLEASPEAAAQGSPSAGAAAMVQGLWDNFSVAGPNPVHQAAESWVGKPFKHGQDARCADFVSTVIDQSGVQPANYQHTVRARDFANFGREVPVDQMQPGDVIGFNNTWRASPDPKHHTHVGIYAGDGQMIHRPTFDGPVVKEPIGEYLSRPRPNLDGVLPPRSIGGVYRMTD